MKKSIPLLVSVTRALRKLGHDMNDARRRRRISVALMAERVDLSKTTIQKIEKGDPTVSMGGYAMVLFALGMHERLADVADIIHDTVGQLIDDDRLPKRIRYPKQKNGGS